jgi:hypothetical protein
MKQRTLAIAGFERYARRPLHAEFLTKIGQGFVSPLDLLAAHRGSTQDQKLPRFYATRRGSLFRFPWYSPGVRR